MPGRKGPSLKTIRKKSIKKQKPVAQKAVKQKGVPNLAYVGTFDGRATFVGPKHRRRKK